MCPRGFRTMSSSILHRCPSCGHVTDISDILADFVENPHCPQCGLSASEGNSKQQDDLVALFNAHMNMEPSPSPERNQIHSSAPPPITYSITQHYHHSAHVIQRAATSEPMQKNAPSRTNETAGWAIETLRRHNVEPSSLSSSQLELFANAMPDQQSRLIQMWQIYPEPSEADKRLTHLSQSTFIGDFEMCDSTQEQVGGDTAHGIAEPYMLSGYELVGPGSTARQTLPLADEPTTGSPYRLSSDPIYQAGGQWWWERTHSVAMEY